MDGSHLAKGRQGLCMRHLEGKREPLENAVAMECLQRRDQ